MKKTLKPFLLLEVLIAMSLLVIFSGLILQIPVKTHQKDRKMMKEIEGERLLALSIAELKQKFYDDPPPWNVQKKREVSLNDVFLQIPGYENIPVKRCYRIKSIANKQYKNFERQKLIIQIFLTQKSFTKKGEFSLIRSKNKN